VPYKDPEQARENARVYRANNRDRKNAHERKRRAERGEQVRAYHREYYRKNRTVFAATGWRNHLRKKYGLTLEQYDALFENQGSRCAICACTEPRGNKWVVDHCHDTGKVRGITCNSCNTGMGGFADTAALLRKAADYLDQHKDTQ
jgi:hypothetical protein